ncbi:MAG: dUTP diphosphatase [Actinomycetota bacterium]
MEVPFRALSPHAVLPARARNGDAGLDLSAAEDAEVKPGERAMVRTGVAVAIPEGHAGLVLPRSGLASKKGLTLVNAPGLIDAGYRGEIVCAMVNLDPSQAVHVAVGERVAQLVIVALPDAEPRWAQELPSSERGDAGFGSTGA